MKNGRLWEVFVKLTKKERKELSKCVRSPWFNSRESVIQLFDFLNGLSSKCTNIPSNEELHERLFSERKYEDIRIRNTKSFLLKIIERFLSIKEMEANQTSSNVAIASVYRKKQLSHHHRQSIEGGKKVLKEQPLRNADYYNRLYEFELEQYRTLVSQRNLKAMNLQDLSDNLDIAYLTQKLRQTCFLISHQKVYAADYNFGLLLPLLEMAKKAQYQTIPAISLYYHCYFALTQPEEESHFKKFKSLLITHRNEFPDQELHDLYLFATNYCIQRMNNNAPQYASEALELYKEGLKDDLLLPNDRMPHITYSNIVTMSLFTKDYAFAEYFIEQYAPRLAPTLRQSIYSFNLARLQYQKKDFDKALPLLQQEVYKDLLLNLSAKAVSAKIFFELEEYELLLSHLDAMNQFIRRKKVMGYHRDNFQNFITALRKIVETPDFNKAERQSIKEKIKTEQAILERRWLLDQL